MLKLQDVAQNADVAMAAGTSAFEPTLLGWIVLLPLIGFIINGVAALISARDASERLHAATLRPDPSEEEGLADDHHEHPASGDELYPDSDTHSDLNAWTHKLPSIVAPAAIAAAFIIALVNFFGFSGAGIHEPIVQRYWSWMPVGDFQIDAALQLDQLSLLMTLIITGVGALIHVFSIGYMSRDPGYPRYMAYLNLFVFFMLVLVLGASYPVMFVGWEGVGLCSYLLIGFWFKEKANADAGKKAFIVNRIGDFGFLVAMFMIFWHVGSLDFVEVFERAPAQLAFGGAVVTALTMFLFLGAAGKSAQIPLYIWLPDAMAGPTPVSALIHAATMVTAGVYMIVRSATLFSLAPVTSLVVALIGTLTALFAATIGLKQWDIKKVLAYSTVSQLGFMFAAVGMGAYVAGVFHLMTHAFFKALLFLGSGAVIHAMHEALHATHSEADAQDMRNMGGLRKYLPVTFVTMSIATLAIAGIPPFAGFFSKDEIVGAAWLGWAGYSPFSDALLFGIEGRTWMFLIAVLLSITALLTAFYMGRMMVYTFFGPNRTGGVERDHLKEVGWTMTVPLIVLALFSVIGGWFNIDPEIPVANWFTPLAIGGETALHGWLHPVIEGAEAVQMANNAGVTGPVPHDAWPIWLAIIVGVAGLAGAYMLLKPDDLRTPDEHPEYTGALEKLLYNKWWVDEAYDAIVVRPVGRLSAFFSRVVDRGVIDGIVDGTGRLAQSLGLLAGRVQSGQVNTYAFVILAGAIIVLAGLAFGAS